ncbi:hypothetical protein Back2_13580 [Nocardioides baekrokdamisoli]|uniref:Nucleotidyltransferase n=1 Tax=Nocardioides baekrokdamisoli TaxID=1804624 RepID=A0A3G9ITW8_9ACTN|nr:nucleotidyltransferase family protein [Nocardioides baekrokdamisoli]BBH17071.1 hypothetical protein Back2_13580 [Nocardioides baekrokdamisoli]
MADVDLEVQANNLRVDLLTLDASRCLARADIPHVLIKGPTTSLWLYSPPRAYADVDLLVPASRLPDAIDALRAGGIADGHAVGAPHEWGHSVELRSASGFEVDLHRSLPSLPVDGDSLWAELRPHFVDFDLGSGQVPALDEVGRCLTVAFHALSGGGDLSRRWDDLTLAYARADASAWDQARAIAVRLGAADLFDAALTRVGVDPPQPLSRRARLALGDAEAQVIALDRMATTPWRGVPIFLLREVWPTADFIRAAYPDLSARRAGVVRARVRRWLRILSALPGALRAYRSAR